MKESKVIQSGHLVSFLFQVNTHSVLSGVHIQCEEGKEKPTLEEVTFNGVPFDDTDLDVELNPGDVFEVNLRNNTPEAVQVDIELELTPIEHVEEERSYTAEQIVEIVLAHPAKAEILEALFTAVGIKLPKQDAPPAGPSRSSDPPPHL